MGYNYTQRKLVVEAVTWLCHNSLMANHQKKNKPCPICKKLIWQQSKKCGSCSSKEVFKKINTPKYREKMSVIAKEKKYGHWMQGKKLTKEWKENIGKASRKRVKDNPGYSALHMWVKNNLGKPKKCTFCKTNKILHWANKSHKYKRDLNDWISLCIKCHRKYDIGHKGKAIKIFGNLRRVS